MSYSSEEQCTSVNKSSWAMLSPSDWKNKTAELHPANMEILKCFLKSYVYCVRRKKKKKQLVGPLCNIKKASCNPAPVINITWEDWFLKISYFQPRYTRGLQEWFLTVCGLWKKYCEQVSSLFFLRWSYLKYDDQKCYIIIILRYLTYSM